MKRSERLGVTAGAVVGVTLVAAAAALAWLITGPSSSQSPYVVRSQPGVVVKSIVTVGDSVPKAGGGSYRMVGIPDGLGAWENGDGTFIALMNHELGATAGVVRAHGAKGAFVSRWTIQKGSLAVVSASDLIQQVATWNTGTVAYNPPASGVAIGRLCSADLPTGSAFYDAASGKGFSGRIFLSGEEVGAEGRAFAHVAGGPGLGTSYELPYLGKFSWENAVAHWATGEKTVVVGLDDSTPGQVYVYVGQKASSGNPAQRAGLTGGTLYGIKVAGYAVETDASYPGAGTPFTLDPVGVGNAAAMTGAQIETASDADLITEFQRPEDGAWDPNRPSDFYFVTTRDTGFPSRLWRLRFADPANPAAGGTITPLLDGTEGQQMFDNLTVNDRGQVLLQEDPGGDKVNGQNYIAKIWLYDIGSDSLTEIARLDPERFTPGLPGYLTDNEESSGIIPAPFLGEGWYLLDIQAHYSLAATDPELWEGGQLLALRVPPGKFGGT